MRYRLVAALLLCTLSLVASVGAGAQVAMRIDARPSLVIGAGNAEPQAVFSRVMDVRRMPSGEVLVVDGSTLQLRFFGPDGRFLRQTGGRGSGPSEFRDISGVVVHNDSLRAFDASQQKVVTFDMTGRFGSSRAVGSTGDAVRSLRLLRLAGYMNGDMIFVADAYPADMKPIPTRLWDSVPTLRYDRDGKLRDTIGEFSGMDLYATPQQAGDVRFGRYSSAVLSNNRLYMTDGGRLAIRVYDSSRTPRSTITLNRAPRAVTADDNRRYNELRLSMATNADSRTRIERNLAEWPRATVKPWISRLGADDLGNIWAEEYRVFGDTSAVIWHVFSPAGQSLGAVTAPPRFQIKHIGRDFVLGVVRDLDDVETVALHPLRRN